MKITAITKYKHAGLLALLRKLGWSQTELAVRAGLAVSRINEYVNLRRRPTKQDAEIIQRVCAEAGEYLDVLEQWPELFVGLKAGRHKEETMDVPMERLLECKEAMQLPGPTLSYSEEELEDLSQALDMVVHRLNPLEESAVRGVYLEGKSISDLAKERGVCGEAVSYQLESGLRRLRHPWHKGWLERFRP